VEISALLVVAITVSMVMVRVDIHISSTQLLYLATVEMATLVDSTLVMVVALVVMVAAVVLAQELVAILVMVLVIMVVLVLAVVPLVEEIIALHGVGHLVVVQVLGDKDFLELTLHKPDVVV